MKQLLVVMSVFILAPLTLVGAAGESAFSATNSNKVSKGFAPTVSKSAQLKFPSCQDVKEQKLPFFWYGETSTNPTHAYALFFRDRPAMLRGAKEEVCTLSAQDYTDTIKQAQYKVCLNKNKKIRKAFLNKYTNEQVRVTFGASTTNAKGRPVITITASHKKYKNGKPATRRCFNTPKIMCPVIAINDTIYKGRSYVAQPEISCASPDGQGVLSRTLKNAQLQKNRNVNKTNQYCSGQDCRRDTNKSKKSQQDSFVTKKPPNNKSFTTGRNSGYKAPRQPRSQQRPQPKQQAKQGGSNPLGGFMKQLQSALQQKGKQKTQEAARKKKEAEQKRLRDEKLYQARLRLPECHRAHPYYEFNKERCAVGGTSSKPIVTSYGANNTKAAQSSAQRKISINNNNTNNSTNTNNTLAGISAQKCKGKEPKVIIVARPKVVASGQETTIKWASVCTASCKVSAIEIGGTDKEPILTELGRKGEITGKLYNDTRFDIACRDFKDKPSVKSTVTVKLRS